MFELFLKKKLKICNLLDPESSICTFHLAPRRTILLLGNCWALGGLLKKIMILGMILSGLDMLKPTLCFVRLVLMSKHCNHCNYFFVFKCFGNNASICPSFPWKTETPGSLPRLSLISPPQAGRIGQYLFTIFLLYFILFKKVCRCRERLLYEKIPFWVCEVIYIKYPRWCQWWGFQMTHALTHFRDLSDTLKQSTTSWHF